MKQSVFISLVCIIFSLQKVVAQSEYLKSKVTITMDRSVTIVKNVFKDDDPIKSSNTTIRAQSTLKTENAFFTIHDGVYDLHIKDYEADETKLLKLGAKPFSGTLNYDANSTVVSEFFCSESHEKKLIKTTENQQINYSPKKVHLDFVYDIDKKQGILLVSAQEANDVTKTSGNIKTMKPACGDDPGENSDRDISTGLKTTAGFALSSYNFCVNTLANNDVIKGRNLMAMRMMSNDYFGKDETNMNAILGNPAITKTIGGYSITNSYTTTTINKDDGTVSTFNTSIKIMVEEAKPEYVMIIEPEGNDYESWKPKGGINENTHGNTFKVKITIKDKNNLPISKRSKNIVAELFEVSKEPGVCLNQPLQGAKSDPDLKWEQFGEENRQFKIDNDHKMTYTGKGLETHATISCFDWGAFGKLKVTAEMDDEAGTKLTGTWKTTDGKTEITIPYTTGNSHIAESFKKEKSCTSLSDDDDDEKQYGNKNNGDGFTLYEEYRGIVDGKEHKFLDPQKKDLVVENQVDNSVSDGLALFTKASGINIVELKKKGSLPANRLVNVNTSKSHPQYGLFLVKNAKMKEGVLGEAMNISGKQDELIASPKFCKEVQISTTFFASIKSTQLKDAKKADFDNCVAHEIAHGCGVMHHGNSSEGELKVKDISKVYGYHFFGLNGKEIALESVFETFNKAKLEVVTYVGAESKASGDINCIMRYNHAYLLSHVDGVNWKFYLLDLTNDDNIPGTIFCTSGVGTGFNAPKYLPYPVFGNAKKGNCMSQFKVQD